MLKTKEINQGKLIKITFKTFKKNLAIIFYFLLDIQRKDFFSNLFSSTPYLSPEHIYICLFIYKYVD